MHCPRCGAENDRGNRFCVECGLPLNEAGTPEPASARERLGSIVGTTRRARLLSALTALAIAIAVIAFIALSPDEGGTAGDPFLRRLDRECVAAKNRITQLESETLRQSSPNLEQFSAQLVAVVAEWRTALAEASPPGEHAGDLASLEAKLREVLIQAAVLNRAAREGASARVITGQAQAVDRATAAIDPALERLGLEECPAVAVTPSH